MRTKSKVLLVTRRFVLYVLIITSLFPPLWMLATSLKRPVDALAHPPKILFIPTFDNYRELFSFSSDWEGYYILRRYLPNSLLLASVSTLLTLGIAILGAFSVSRYRFPGRRLIMFAVICTRMFAPIAMVIPLFIMINSIGLTDSRIALIIIYTGINLPFAIWMLKGFIDEIPATLEDAAMVDGCSRFASLLRVTFPLIAPGVAAIGIFTFLVSWNDFAIAFFLVSKNAKTLPLQATAFITEVGLHWGPMSAYGTIIMLPALFFGYYCQKYIIRGLTMGAVK